MILSGTEGKGEEEDGDTQEGDSNGILWGQGAGQAEVAPSNLAPDGSGSDSQGGRRQLSPARTAALPP